MAIQPAALTTAQDATHDASTSVPVRPYARLLLTIEPSCLILAPYPFHRSQPYSNNHPVSEEPSSSDGRLLFNLYGNLGGIHQAIRVQYRLEPVSTTTDQNEATVPATQTDEPIQDSINNSNDFGQSRVSYLDLDSYVRSPSAKDYIVYGCIGLLDLYTGPHLIVITSVKNLGDIEDKPVYMVDKVAVLPMDAQEACHVLDRLAAEAIDPTHLGQQESNGTFDSKEESLTTQEETLVEPQAEALVVEPPQAETQVESQPEAPPTSTAPKSPKIKFSLFGNHQDKRAVSAPSLPSSVPAASNAQSSSKSPRLSGVKRISFEIPALSLASRSSTDLSASKDTSKTTPLNQSPEIVPLSPTTRSTSPGFFAKLKESISEKKNNKRSLEINATAATETPFMEDTRNVSDDDTAIEAKDKEPEHIILSSPTDPTASTPEIESEPPQSPSPLVDATEQFVVNTTKKLANWGEGMLKASTSFNLTKPSSVSSNLTGESSVHETGSMTQGGLSEEELEKNKSLDKRIIREICSLLGTGFYFATEFNLLSSMQKRSGMMAGASAAASASRKYSRTVPLWQQVDRRFWWNEYLQKELLAIEANGFILPVMQGYVETEPCEIEEQAFEFTLISRRSKDRSGLRYQRRGIDEQGNTANFVETEQLLRIVRNDSDHQVSFVQTRGSIPLFWSQSPYRLKPIPVMERSEQENFDGFKAHVDSLILQYGKQIFISLVEQHGRELIAGAAYTRYVEKLAEPLVRYVEFDFHEECKGMKYENIDKLIKSLEAPIQDLGYCWLAPDKSGPKQAEEDGDIEVNDSEHFQRLHEQKGVIRTNCMDCLDRTNVVQSAIGRHILNHQLLRLGIASFPDQGLSVYEDFENVFNNVWANNGDAISREYAGTSALKGDFTRTGKRNLQGMVNDATNSIARMYQNTFKDYFRQAAIDYLLGHADVNVFKNLQTTPFGTAVVPPPILAPPSSVSSSGGEEPVQVALSDEAPTQALIPTLLPSLISKSPSSSTTSLSLVDRSISAVSEQESPEIAVVVPMDPAQEKAMQQETWVKIREAAIETAAEIVISPGEECWKGWTFICCSNEISSALVSSSSTPPSSAQVTPHAVSDKGFKKNKVAMTSDRHPPPHHHHHVGHRRNNDSKQERDGENEPVPPVFYDEKIVLLTERALYICTYDYDMEKVLEFWRLALEKMTGIDKGPFFLTSQDMSSMGQNPLENAGFAVNYRANSDGETLRVNRGSVRNRRVMESTKSPFDPALEKVQEKDEEEEEEEEEGDKVIQESGQKAQSPRQNQDEDHLPAHGHDGCSGDIGMVRFKIVKHPEISVVPYMTSAEVGVAERAKANPVGYKRTAQDCVEWVVTEIVQARCELISVAEERASKGDGKVARSKEFSTPSSSPSQRPPVSSLDGQVMRGRESGRSSHGRSPSEEYNYRSPKDHRNNVVQVDLVIRDRVLQSLEMAAHLEGCACDSDKKSDAAGGIGSTGGGVGVLEEGKSKKKARRGFSKLFSSRDKLDVAANQEGTANTSSKSPSNRSWLNKARKFQFGQDSEDESTSENVGTTQKLGGGSAVVVAKSTKEGDVEESSTLPLSVADGSPARLEVDSDENAIGPQTSSVQVEEESVRTTPARSPNQSSVFSKIRQAVKNL
ncbi:hypothetical protein BGZ94_004735 [Podila epigama]|nr:hypothetical protein BGZ94_004735 [Podila epigama]